MLVGEEKHAKRAAQSRQRRCKIDDLGRVGAAPIGERVESAAARQSPKCPPCDLQLSGLSSRDRCARAGNHCRCRACCVGYEPDAVQDSLEYGGARGATRAVCERRAGDGSPRRGSTSYDADVRAAERARPGSGPAGARGSRGSTEPDSWGLPAACTIRTRRARLHHGQPMMDVDSAAPGAVLGVVTVPAYDSTTHATLLIPCWHDAEG